MGVFLAFATKNALMVQMIDTYLPTGVDDAARTEAKTNVNYMPLFIFKESQITRLGFLHKSNLSAAVHLLRSISGQDFPHGFINNLGKSRTVDAKKTTSAPEIGRIDEAFGHFHDLGLPLRHPPLQIKLPLSDNKSVAILSIETEATAGRNQLHRFIRFTNQLNKGQSHHIIRLTHPTLNRLFTTGKPILLIHPALIAIKTKTYPTPAPYLLQATKPLPQSALSLQLGRLRRCAAYRNKAEGTDWTRLALHHALFHITRQI